MTGLEVAVAQTIEACDGDLRATIRALILANEFLETKTRQAIGAVLTDLYVIRDEAMVCRSHIVAVAYMSA